MQRNLLLFPLFLPLFLTSFSSSSSQKFLKRSAPVSVNWMPQSPKAEAPMGPEETELPLLSTRHPPQGFLEAWLAAGTQPQAFHKPKPQRVLRRPGSSQLCLRKVGGQNTCSASSGRRALRSLSANRKVQAELPSQFSGGPAA